MEFNRGWFEIQIDRQTVKCFLSMWIMDENRLQKIYDEKPDSFIQKGAAQFYVCYLNACRKEKTDPVLTMQDFYDWYDESFVYNREYIAEIQNALAREIQKLFPPSDEKPETEAPENGEKKIIGLTSEPLPLAN